MVEGVNIGRLARSQVVAMVRACVRLQLECCTSLNIVQCRVFMLRVKLVCVAVSLYLVAGWLGTCCK